MIDSPAQTSLPQRAVDAIATRLSRSGVTRRRFLTRAAVVGSALAIDPTGFLVRPRTAYASVCGDANEFHEGWSAFCATINDGANTCPPHSYAAGWWKIDNSTFCSGRPRYIVDCNRRPNRNCNCHAADGQCDHRRVCCNNFRYGQCNTHIRGTTEVVCRIVICTPPWRWDRSCTRTSRTSNVTRTHWSAALPPRGSPTPITVRWLEMGLAGSILGRMRGDERAGPNGGRWARFERGVMTHSQGHGTHFVRGPHMNRYLSLDAAEGPLGYLVRDVRRWNPPVVRYNNGRTYRTPTGTWALWDRADQFYWHQGARQGWLRALTGNARNRPGPWVTAPTASGWHVVHQTSTGEARALRTTGGLSEDGAWPPTAAVSRIAAPNGRHTMDAISERTHPDGADTVVLVRDNKPWHSLAGVAVAAALDAPVLLSGHRQLWRVTSNEIDRLAPDRIVVLAKPSYVDRSVLQDLRRRGYTVERWARPSRIGTSVVAALNAFPDGADHVVVTPSDFARLSMAASPLAASVGGPILLTRPRSLPNHVAHAIDRLGATRATIVGNSSEVRPAVASRLRRLGLHVERVDGPYLAHEVMSIARRLPASNRVAVANGDNFRDQLAAACLGVRGPFPLLLTSRGIPVATDAEILRRRPDLILAVGSRHDVPGDVVRALRGYPRN